MELVKISRVASWAPDMKPREVREHLKYLHRLHGDLLFKKATTRRAVYWVSVEALRARWPSRFGEGPNDARKLLRANAKDLAAVHSRLDAVQATADRALEVALRGGDVLTNQGPISRHNRGCGS
jgi:hypothetical protein